MFRSIFAIFILFCVAGTATVAAKPIGDHGTRTLRTPYDDKYQRVHAYLASFHLIDAGLWNPSFSVQQTRIQRHLHMARRFQFQEENGVGAGGTEDHWQLPEETETLGGGDCEDLAIWLYCRLLDAGFHNIRLTIGFAGTEVETMHAWVTWHERKKTYILDPSRSDEVVRLDQLEEVVYRPQYSFYLDQRWRHQ